MRINKFIAASSEYSRRKADELIQAGRVTVNGQTATQGLDVSPDDTVLVDGKQIAANEGVPITIVFHKPVGYVCSRNGQGSATIYDILPPEYQQLQPVGRLDKDSSGLLLMTNDGKLANELTHPRYGKTKVYEIQLNKSLEPLHQQMISDFGVTLEDGPSKLTLEKLADAKHFRVTMSEGRNRQIRRTFTALGYTVTKLHRTSFGPYRLGNLGTRKTAPTSSVN